MYIKTFDGAAVIFTEEQDRTCTHPDGHDFNPDNGAMFGDNGNCCAHCGHFAGQIWSFSAANGAEEAQAYAQAMLGATGPVEVRKIEWKWGPGDVPKSPIVSAAKNFELLFDSGGGITLITPNYCHSYDDPQCAAHDVAALLDGSDPQDWDGNHPEFRRERHPEDDVMTADMAQSIREGSPWTRRGHAWNEFCAALAPSMTQDEMLLAERAADTLVDLIRSLKSRDPQHPEIANLNKLYGEILHAAVRCIPRVNIEEVRHA